MTKPSTDDFHFVEGVFRFEKHALVAVRRNRVCAFCHAEPPIPLPIDVSAAIEHGRDFVEPFGEEEGDYWPDNWVEIADGVGKLCACPACAEKMLAAVGGKP